MLAIDVSARDCSGLPIRTGGIPPIGGAPPIRRLAARVPLHPAWSCQFVMLRVLLLNSIKSRLSEGFRLPRGGLHHSHQARNLEAGLSRGGRRKGSHVLVPPGKHGLQGSQLREHLVLIRREPLQLSKELGLALDDDCALFPLDLGHVFHHCAHVARRAQAFLCPLFPLHNLGHIRALVRYGLGAFFSQLDFQVAAGIVLERVVTAFLAAPRGDKRADDGDVIAALAHGVVVGRVAIPVLHICVDALELEQVVCGIHAPTRSGQMQGSAFVIIPEVDVALVEDKALEHFHVIVRSCLAEKDCRIELPHVGTSIQEELRTIFVICMESLLEGGGSAFILGVHFCPLLEKQTHVFRASFRGGHVQSGPLAIDA
mmetsp:Transcript_12153/g.32621  ORF Transcript_12153/g.32621 Transcript_12153/m.32621 type:complete len:371 (+) Transcript_12153:848-1960(+)